MISFYTRALLLRRPHVGTSTTQHDTTRHVTSRLARHVVLAVLWRVVT